MDVYVDQGQQQKCCNGMVCEHDGDRQPEQHRPDAQGDAAEQQHVQEHPRTAQTGRAAPRAEAECQRGQQQEA